MSKILLYGKDARQLILNGVEKLTRTVAVTLGPRGRNVIVGKSIGAPVITKDGVSVAREVVLDDPVEEQGCQLVKEVAGRTADVAGDGTTTAIVLAHEIFSTGKELIDSGYSVINFRYGINWALEQVLSELAASAQPVEDYQKLNHIATISTNNDPELGRIVAEAYHLAGKDGMVTAEAKPGLENSVRQINGMELKTGYLSASFLDEGKGTAILENCYVLICNRELSTLSDNATLFNEVAISKRPLLIIAPDVNKSAKQNLLINQQHGQIRVCPIKLPTFGPEQHLWLECLAMLLSTVIVDEENGVALSDLTLADLGEAERVEIGKYLTKIIGPKRNEPLIRHTLDIYRQDREILLSELARKDLDNRAAFLSSQATVITVGYSTDLELREKGDRIEDAMAAVRAAMKSGFVVGGGFALLNAVKQVDLDQLESKYHAGAQILLNACTKPAKKIIENAGFNAEEILQKCEDPATFGGNLEPSSGYNTATEEFGDLVEMGVIDPKKVTETALTNATSIASLLIQTEAIIVDNPERESGWQPPAGFRLADQTKLNHKY